MSESPDTQKHTPGPWHRNIKPARKYAVIFAGRNTHVCVLDGIGKSDAEVEANCDLIASAPELLEALKLAIPYLEDASSSVLRLVHDAILKAEGHHV